jgi:hypothetical protein
LNTKVIHSIHAVRWDKTPSGGVLFYSATAFLIQLVCLGVCGVGIFC